MAMAASQLEHGPDHQRYRYRPLGSGHSRTGAKPERHIDECDRRGCDAADRTLFLPELAVWKL
jgi:hypothetical protein